MDVAYPDPDPSRLKVIKEICETDRASTLKILDLRRQQSDLVKSLQYRIDELRVKSRSDGLLRNELDKLEHQLPKEKARLKELSLSFDALESTKKASSDLARNCESFLEMHR